MRMDGRQNSRGKNSVANEIEPGGSCGVSTHSGWSYVLGCGVCTQMPLRQRATWFYFVPDGISGLEGLFIKERQWMSRR